MGQPTTDKSGWPDFPFIFVKYGQYSPYSGGLSRRIQDELIRTASFLVILAILYLMRATTAVNERTIRLSHPCPRYGHHSRTVS